MISRRDFLAAPMPLLAARQQRRPNVIVLLTHDQGYGDPAYYATAPPIT